MNNSFAISFHYSHFSCKFVGLLPIFFSCHAISQHMILKKEIKVIKLIAFFKLMDF